MSFNNQINYIKPGEPVSAGVPNRPLTQLEQNTRYLKDRLDAADLGATLFAPEVTVEPEVTVGTPVWFNPQTQRYERALVTTQTDSLTNQPVLASAAHVWGVVHTKINATKASLLIAGYTDLDLTQALADGETLTAGVYYLSAVTAGRITRTRPAIVVRVLLADGYGRVFVMPHWDEALSAHTHLHFQLNAVPAGTHIVPAPLDPHEITDPDDAIEGWLPADHAVFAGNAPAGAKFGYNIAANPALAAAWPPVPIDEAVLLRDGLQLASGDGGIVAFDRNGIWWLSDCYSDVPWPALVAYPLTVSDSASDDAACPPTGLRLDLYFTKFGFMSDQTAVTSLITTDPRVKIFCPGDPDTPASVGALQIALDLAFALSTADNATGALAFKELNAQTGVFTRGPVASGLFAASPSVVLTSPQMPITKTINDVSRSVYYGDVGVDVVTDNDRELYVQLIRLESVVQEYIDDIMYLGMPTVLTTSLRGRIHVPSTLDITDPQLRLRFRLLGRVAGTAPAITVTYRRVPAVTTPTALPDSGDEQALANLPAVVFTAVNQYVDVTTDPIPDIQPGDDLLFTLTRAGTLGYAGTLGFMRFAGLVSPA